MIKITRRRRIVGVRLLRRRLVEHLDAQLVPPPDTRTLTNRYFYKYACVQLLPKLACSLSREAQGRSQARHPRPRPTGRTMKSTDTASPVPVFFSLSCATIGHRHGILARAQPVGGGALARPWLRGAGRGGKGPRRGSAGRAADGEQERGRRARERAGATQGPS